MPVPFRQLPSGRIEVMSGNLAGGVSVSPTRLLTVYYLRVSPGCPDVEREFHRQREAIHAYAISQGHNLAGQEVAEVARCAPYGPVPSLLKDVLGRPEVTIIMTASPSRVGAGFWGMKEALGSVGRRLLAAGPDTSETLFPEVAPLLGIETAVKSRRGRKKKEVVIEEEPGE